MSADVNSNLASWSASEGSNQPQGSTAISTNMDDNLRQIQATVRKYLATKGSDIASAGTVDLSTADGLIVDITGTTTTTGFGTLSAGMWKILQFDGAVPLKYNATSMILPGAADLTTSAGDHLIAYSLGSGNWIVPFYSASRDNSFRVCGSSDITKVVMLEVDTHLATATTVTLTVPGQSGTVALGGDAQGLFLPRGYLAGLALTYQSGTSFDVAAGQCRDSTNAANITLSSARTGCTLTASTAWASGNSANKLNNQTIPSAGTLHVFAMRKDSDGTGDIIIDASLTPTRPSGYTYYRRIASLRTSSSAWIRWFQYGDQFNYNSPQNDSAGFASLSTTAANYTITVPSGIKVLALIHAWASTASNTTGVRVFDPALADVAIDPSSNGLSSVGATVVGGTIVRIVGSLQVMTNTSAQVRAVSASAVDGADLRTFGWIDRRGRDD